ncbi:MAG: hypothetical protein EPN91_12785, partial [Salinibacterium sp.]
MPRKPKSKTPEAPAPATFQEPPREVVLQRAGYEQVVKAALELPSERKPGVFQRDGWLEGLRLVGAYDEIVSDTDPDVSLSITAIDVLAKDWRLTIKGKRPL